MPRRGGEVGGRGLAAASYLLLGVIGYGCLRKGGFYADDFQVMLGGIVVVAVALLAWGGGAGRWPFLVVASLSVGATAASSVLAGTPLGAGLPAMALGLAVATAVGIGATAGPQRSERLVYGVLAVAVAVAATAWLGVFLRRDGWVQAAQGMWRGASTLTYTNAAASMAGMGLALVVSRLVGRRGPLLYGAAYVLVVGLVCAMSRAGWVAALLGLAVVAVSVGWRPVAEVTVPLLVGGLVAMAGLLPSTVEVEPTRPLFAVAGLVAGAVVAGALSRRAGWSTRPAGRVALVIVGLACITVVGIAVAARSDVLLERLDLTSTDRAREWGVAWSEFAAEPLSGVGPGQLDLVWNTPSGARRSAQFTHNEYLELAATHGVVGLAALAAGGALFVRALRAPGRTAPTWVRAGAGGAAAGFAAHTALDFFWHMPALAMTAALLCGLLISRAEDAPPLDARLTLQSVTA